MALKHEEEQQKLKAELKLLKHCDEIEGKNANKDKMIERIRALLVEEIERLDAIHLEKEMKLKNEIYELKQKHS